MKICRFIHNDVPRYGIVTENGVTLCDGELTSGLNPTTVTVHPEKYLSPIDPVMIVGIGLNYRFHAEETNAKIPEWPVVFFKALGALTHPDAEIRLPRKLLSHKVDYEAELAVVIGKDCLNATKENALDFVLGYTCANDVSARDWQKEWGGSQWSRAKSFDTFCPLGPWITTADEIPNPNELKLSATLNGEKVQDWSTNDMIFDVRSLIEFMSADTTLPAGTVILTGTPHGVGMARTPPLWLKPGDEIIIEVERIGQLRNTVV